MRRCKIILSHWLKTVSMVLLFSYALQAQAQVRSYSIKNGKMFITVGKNIATTALDSFINKYELADLDLQHFIKHGLPDSLHKLGWAVDVNNKEIFVISKPLSSAADISDPVNKIIFTQKEGADLVTTVNQVNFGTNKFRNKTAFAISDSVVTFFLRAQTNAANVKLAGSFTNWQNGALPMSKTDSGWIVYVKLAAGKHLYKFIIDNNWTIDRDNSLVENDGKGNENSVYFKPNYTFTLAGYSNSKRVYLSGSFNNWKEKDLLMQRTVTGWSLPVYLPKGTHTYRFIADGKWFTDPANTEKLPNEFDDYNSVIQIGSAYIFKLDGFADAKKVTVFGSFNNWKNNELQMTKTATGWQLPYTLGPGNYEYKFSVDGKEIADEVTKGNFALVIEPNFTFRLKGFDAAKTVTVAGDINNWNPTSFRMKKVGDEWIFPAHLDKGKHRYKFVVDGKWILDPANKLWEQNEYDTGNSILWIEQDL